MADVAIRYRILPTSADVDLGKLRAQIALLGAKEIRERPIAFGLRFLEVLFVVPDKQGSAIEVQLRKLPGVAEVETESITLV